VIVIEFKIQVNIVSIRFLSRRNQRNVMGLENTLKIPHVIDCIQLIHTKYYPGTQLPFTQDRKDPVQTPNEHPKTPFTTDPSNYIKASTAKPFPNSPTPLITYFFYRFPPKIYIYYPIIMRHCLNNLVLKVEIWELTLHSFHILPSCCLRSTFRPLN